MAIRKSNFRLEDDDDEMSDAALLAWHIEQLKVAVSFADDAGDEQAMAELEDQVRRLEDELRDAGQRIAEAEALTEQKIKEAMASVAAARPKKR
jgi:predicted  nucleic acid-binding Zn-ribbon protein